MAQSGIAAQLDHAHLYVAVYTVDVDVATNLEFLNLIKGRQIVIQLNLSNPTLA